MWPVIGLSQISAACSPRPASTWRSRQLKQVLSVAPANQRPYVPPAGSNTRSQRRSQVMPSAAAAHQRLRIGLPGGVGVGVVHRRCFLDGNFL